jgi:hypothetical protein
MRKKVRTISVNGRKLVWTIEEKLWPSMVLRVWRTKGDVWFEKELRADDGPVTPKDVANEIRSRLDEPENE